MDVNEPEYEEFTSTSDIVFFSFINKLEKNNMLDLEDEKFEETLNKLMFNEDFIEKDQQEYIDETLKYYGYRIREDERINKSVFESHLEQTYGYAFYFLDLIYLLSVDLGKIAFKNCTEDSYLDKVVLRLHSRSCSIFSEIIYLLKGGFGTGAITRLRSLHESAVISEFILKHGESSAEAYWDYIEVMQAKNANFLKTLYGDEEDLIETLNNFDSNKYKLEKKYNADFVNLKKDDYIWSKKFLQNKKFNGFNAIRKDVQRTNGTEQYKLASNNIHAAPISLVSSLNTLDGQPSTGASNIGISEPACWTIFEMLQLNVSLLKIIREKNNDEVLEEMKAIFLIRLIEHLIPEAYESFNEAEKEVKEN